MLPASHGGSAAAGDAVDRFETAFGGRVMGRAEGLAGIESAARTYFGNLPENQGCGIGSDCDITGFAGTTVDEICQSWFAAVTAALRAKGYCAGQHIVGSTDEIAVSNTGCGGKWYGYHICNYGGPKVVWNPGARRGWWMIKPSYCN